MAPRCPSPMSPGPFPVRLVRSVPMRSWRAKLTFLLALAMPVAAFAATHGGACCPFCPHCPFCP